MYACNFAILGSPFKVWKPPAACHDEPLVNSDLSIRIISFQPAFARWYKTEHPTTPPPITMALACVFINFILSLTASIEIKTSVNIIACILTT